MLSDELSLAAIVIGIAGIIGVTALLISKLTNLLKRSRGEPSESGSYECGFLGKTHDFSYLSENVVALSLFLILELMTTWILFCCIMISSGIEKIILKYALVVLFFSIIFAYKAVFRKER